MICGLFSDRILSRSDLMKSSYDYTNLPRKKNIFFFFTSENTDHLSPAVHRYFNCERPGFFRLSRKFHRIDNLPALRDEIAGCARLFLCPPFAFSAEIRELAESMKIPLTEITIEPLSREELQQHLRETGNCASVPLTAKQRKMNFSFLYRFFQMSLITPIYFLLFPFVKIVYGFSVKNRKVLRRFKKQGLCFVANHCFLLDGPLMHIALFPHSPYITAWEHTLRNRWARFFLKAVRVLPIDTTAESFKQLNDEAEQIFKMNHYMLFYPEGSMRPYSQALRPFVNGSFFLAALQNRTLIPAVFTFRERRFFSHRFYPKITLHFLDPVVTEEVRSRFPRTKQLADHLSAVTHERMSSFMKQYYDSVK